MKYWSWCNKVFWLSNFQSFRVKERQTCIKSPFEIQVRSKKMIKHEFLDSCWVQQYSDFCLQALTLMTADLSKKNNFFLSIKDWFLSLFRFIIVFFFLFLPAWSRKTFEIWDTWRCLQEMTNKFGQHILDYNWSC